MYIVPRTRCAGLLGAATWPCVPRHIHAGPARKSKNFFYLLKTGLKIENKIRKTV